MRAGRVRLSRRELLARSAYGIGTLALASMLTEQGALAVPPASPLSGAGQRPKSLHFKPRAKRVLMLFMDGGVSQVDSFDPKPKLQAEDGQPFKMPIEATQFDQNGRTMGSPYKFAQYGQSGIPVSSLFPHIASCVDDLCVVRSMQSPFAEHSQSCLLLHTGHPLQGRPSLGAWLSYGLGSESANLPGYVVLNGGQLPLGGLQNYGSGFLPALHSGSLFHVGAETPIVDNIVPAESQRRMQTNKLRLIAEDDRDFAAQSGSGESAIESAIHNYELAFAMQTSVPEATDLAGETAATLDAYGVTSSNKFQARYARQCLLARRLMERGVRFVELTCVAGLRNVSPWDSHSNLRVEHQKNADVVDRPIAALLKDLKARGLLEDTLVVWAGEFGRTPFAQGSAGRDHNPQGYSIWLTGAGIRGGMIHGATDEYGYRAVENVVTPHDLQATILYLLGLDHEKLTFRYSGRDFRLTDVHGRVMTEWLT
jgi:hypothetical protein